MWEGSIEWVKQWWLRADLHQQNKFTRVAGATSSHQQQPEQHRIGLIRKPCLNLSIYFFVLLVGIATVSSLSESFILSILHLSYSNSTTTDGLHFRGFYASHADFHCIDRTECRTTYRKLKLQKPDYFPIAKHPSTEFCSDLTVAHSFNRLELLPITILKRLIDRKLSNLQLNHFALCRFSIPILEDYYNPKPSR